MKTTATTSYQLLYNASVVSFLIQAIGARGVRVMAVPEGAPTPADDAEGYFVMKQAPGYTNAITRFGLEGADLYVRSDSESATANLSHYPAVSV